MKMMHIWSTFRLMVANPGLLWKMAAIVTKYIYIFFKFFKYCKEQCCYQTIMEQCIHNILFQTMNDDPDCHQTWPLPLLKKSVIDYTIRGRLKKKKFWTTGPFKIPPAREISSWTDIKGGISPLPRNRKLKIEQYEPH
jgi:hypothetical protein